MAEPAMAEPGHEPDRIVREAPAKLNLTLAVIRRRADGYHALHSVMVPLSLADTVTVSLARVSAPPSQKGLGDSTAEFDSTARLDSLAISGFEVSGVGQNLVLRAIVRARAAVSETWPSAPALPPPLAAELVKRIPIASGLGGGSSDAASALDAALEAWDATLSIDRALAVAMALGSDVPFFLASGAARISGRGEFVDPLPDLKGRQPAVLLVTPRVAVSTREVFEAFSRGVRPIHPEAAQDVSERLAADMAAGLRGVALLGRAAELATSNDLLPASVAVVPTLLPFRIALARLLALPVGQSGSGPTSWTLYSSLTAARKAARVVEKAIQAGMLPDIGHGPPFVVATTILTRPAASPADRATSPADDNRGHRVPRGGDNVAVSEPESPTNGSVGESAEQDER
jgi:4-diphosphocytidyl-2-C-methyl-D-erythritol kinase